MMTEELSNDRPPPSISSDTLKKIMWLYRTRNCPLNKRGQCNYGSRCFDSHESQPERRAPKQNEYNDWHPSTMKCTSNVPNENCKYGRACYFAHNDFEVNYHPTMYKTKICTQFEKEGTCKLGMICPNYHYLEEQRKIEKGSLAADCKSDGLSRKAPPPQEFRRWLDEELRLSKANNSSNQFINGNGSNTNSNGNNHLHNNNMHVISNKNKENVGDINMKLKVDEQDIVDHKEIVDKIVSAHQLKQNESSKLHKPIDSKLVNKSKEKNGGDPNIENEVEIELPSSHSQQPQNLNISQPNLMLRNVTDSPSSSSRFASSPPFNPQQQHQQWHQKNNASRPEHYLPSSSPHLNRALSTGSNLPSLPHSHNNLHYSHSHGHSISTLSYRSGRSGKSSGTRSQRSGKSGKSGKSSKSKRSSKSLKSKTSVKSKTSKSSKKSKSSNRSSRRTTRKSKKNSTRKLHQKREQFEKQSLEIIKNYKINACKKSKCNDIMCPNYHSFEDRRRSPFVVQYSNEACPRIFDAKTRKFTDSSYGCPANENCEFAHNYLEIWYHPKVFHTKLCPILKYQKGCPWGFKCSHYHKKSQKRSNGIIHNSINSAINSINSIHSLNSPMASAQYGFHGNHLQQQQVQQQQQAQQHLMNGPQRPPLANNHNRGHKQPPLNDNNNNVNNPYSNVSAAFDGHQHQQAVKVMNNMNMVNQVQDANTNQIRNGLMSPNFDHHSTKSSSHDTSYSFNPLMQGIAPSINSWRQKNN